MKRKKESRQDDRKNFNDEIKSQFRAFRNFSQRAIRNGQNLSQRDIDNAKKEYGLKNLQRLRRYLSYTDQVQLNNDPMLKWIDNEFRRTIEDGHQTNANLGESERSWLINRLGLTEEEVDTLNQLIDGQDVRQLFPDQNQKTIDVLRRIVETFIDEFNLFDFNEGWLPAYLEATQKVLVGTSLICEDGLRIYNTEQPSVNSIKAGFLLFVSGANSLLQRSGQTAQEG